jgi:hypothetical protein
MAMNFIRLFRIAMTLESSFAQGARIFESNYLQIFLRNNSKYESGGMSSGVKSPSFSAW